MVMPTRLARRSRSNPPSPADWLRLESQLCFAVYSTSLALTKRYKPLLQPLDLTYPQYLVLLVLWQHDGLSVNQLGKQLFLDSGTLTPLLKRMETAGWLTRTRAFDDERRVIVSLAAAGKALLPRAVSVARHLAHSTGCSTDELLALTRRLQELRRHLHDGACVGTAAAQAH